MHLWIRHDAARFVRPGFDPADVFPTLARKPDAAKAAAFDAEIAARYRLLDVLREQVAEIRADMKRRRELEEKYSPSQPRVPAGNPRGGSGRIEVEAARLRPPVRTRARARTRISPSRWAI